MTPKISVIVACYNQADYVAEALASIQAQTFEDWEAIVVDDGSTDESVSIISRYLSDRRFLLIAQPHAGQPQAKNAGILATRGEFLAFLDADDRWHPEKLARQLKVFENRKTVDVCYTRRTLIDPEGRPTGRDDLRPFHRGLVLDAMFRDNFVCFSSAMVRRQVVEHLGLFDERLQLGIDYEWWLRLSRSYVFDYIDMPLVDYRVGHSQLSRRAGKRLDSALTVMRRFIRDYDHPRKLSAKARRRGFAESYRHRGLLARSESRWQALCWLLQSLVIWPRSLATYRAIATTLMPFRVRKTLQRIAKRPHWEVRRAACLVFTACCLLPTACF